MFWSSTISSCHDWVEEGAAMEVALYTEVGPEAEVAESQKETEVQRES